MKLTALKSLINLYRERASNLAPNEIASKTEVSFINEKQINFLLYDDHLQDLTSA